MAFDLKSNNILGTGSLVSPSGQLASAATYINPYSYSMQFRPDLMAQLHLKKGKGKLMPFCAITGSLLPFASDEVRHAELGDLHEAHTGVARATDSFTTTTPHNLRIGEVIMLSDGNLEDQAVVSEITSPTVFVALNKKDAAWAIGATGVTVSKFSNIFGKGEGNFTEGREDNPDYITNYPHIIKGFYKENESDMAHHTWIKAPQYPGGEGWFNTELARTEDEYDNLIELTHLFHQRSDSGSAAVGGGFQRGMKGIVQQIEERGNIGNEAISGIEELSDVAFRIKQQGGATTYTWWNDHDQQAKFRQMLAGVNAHYANGADYGMFNNDTDHIKLGFKSCYIDGISFFVQNLGVLDEPQLLGAAGLNATSIQSLMIPAGEMNVLEQGNQYSRPYMTIRYRQMNGIDRFKKTKFFGGVYGTDHKEDTFEMHIKTEMTNQVIGGNQFFAFRRGNQIYSGS